MSEKKRVQSNVPAYDETLGVQSLERLRARLAAIPAERVLRVTVDVRSAAVVGLKVLGIVERPEVRRRFGLLAKEVFDPSMLDSLRDVVFASWYVRGTSREEATRDNEAKVSAELVEEATETKQRMLRVLGFVMANDESVEAELGRIRAGTGYVDLASDLTHLALLYDQHGATLRKEPIWYRDGDVAIARSQAKRILEQVGTKGANDWSELLGRLWTLFREVYEEVQATGQFLFRHEPLAAEFPSLFTATRTRRGPSEEEGIGTREEENAPIAAPAPATAPANGTSVGTPQ